MLASSWWYGAYACLWRGWGHKLASTPGLDTPRSRSPSCWSSMATASSAKNRQETLRLKVSVQLFEVVQIFWPTITCCQGFWYTGSYCIHLCRCLFNHIPVMLGGHPTHLTVCMWAHWWPANLQHMLWLLLVAPYRPRTPHRIWMLFVASRRAFALSHGTMQSLLHQTRSSHRLCIAVIFSEGFCYAKDGTFFQVQPHRILRQSPARTASVGQHQSAWCICTGQTCK